VEINGKPRYPHEELLRRTFAAGVQFSFGSDVHHLTRIPGAVDYWETMIGHLRLTEADLFDACAPRHLCRSAEAWTRVAEMATEPRSAAF
jgi:hypothetical protein